MIDNHPVSDPWLWGPNWVSSQPIWDDELLLDRDLPPGVLE